jgi:hypothetical protein
MSTAEHRELGRHAAVQIWPAASPDAPSGAVASIGPVIARRPRDIDSAFHNGLSALVSYRDAVRGEASTSGGAIEHTSGRVG